VYDTDAMHKQCLVTRMENSPILYGNMSHSKVQRTGMPSCCSPAEIGPGSYDCPIRSDIRTSLVLNQNPLSRCGALNCMLCEKGMSLRSTCKVLVACFEVHGLHDPPPVCSMHTRALRLATDKVDPTKNLGSTWKQERDSKYWSRGQTIAKAHPRL
jgi:hypothetical protein